MLISIGEIITRSWKFYRENFRVLLVYMAMIFLPTLVIGLLSIMTLYLNSYIPGSTLISNLIMFMIFVASLVFTLWASIALAHAIKMRLLNQTLPHWRELFSSTSHLIAPVILVSLLIGVIIFAGTLLLIIPGIIFAIWYSFSYYAVIFEEKKVGESLGFSKQLVVGRWWKICLRIIIPGIIFGIIMSVIQYAIDWPINNFFAGNFWVAAIQSALASLLSSIMTPLVHAATIILYLSAKDSQATKITQ